LNSISKATTIALIHHDPSAEGLTLYPKQQPLQSFTMSLVQMAWQGGNLLAMTSVKRAWQGATQQKQSNDKTCTRKKSRLVKKA
jgi:hypothetical protein